MSKNTILIIEDEALLLDILSKKFTNEGYRVIKAKDGNEGLGKIKKSKFDLILLDMMLPGVDGYGILEYMKKRGINIPVIVISNSGQPVDVKKAFDLGACDFLIKSKFEPEEIVEKIRHCINSKKIENCGKKKCTKIMVVEDDRFLRDLCVKKLLAEGFCVDIAVEGEEAYDKIRCKKPDLVLLDVVMPGMNGFDVLEKIRADKDKDIAGTKIIIFSNLGQDDDLKKARELGANDFFLKANLDINNIGKKIQELLKE